MRRDRPQPVADGSEAVGGPAGQADAEAVRRSRGQVRRDEAADETARAEHHDVQGAGVHGEGHRSTLAARRTTRWRVRGRSATIRGRERAVRAARAAS